MSSNDHHHSPVDDQVTSSAERSAESTPGPSRRNSHDGDQSKRQKGKHRVNFDDKLGFQDEDEKEKKHFIRDENTKPVNRPYKPLPRARGHPRHSSWENGSYPYPAVTDVSEDVTEAPARSPGSRPRRPGIFRLPSSDETIEELDEDHGDDHNEDAATDREHEQDDKLASLQTAHDKAERLSKSLTITPDRQTRSAPGSKLPSPIHSPPPSPTLSQGIGLPIDMTNIPMAELEKRETKKYGIDDSDDEEADLKSPQKKQPRRQWKKAAKRLVSFGRGSGEHSPYARGASSPELRSGQNTPVNETYHYDDYVPRPKAYRGGVLGALLKIYNEQGIGSAISSHPRGPGIPARAFKPYSGRSRLPSGFSTPNVSPRSSPTGSLDGSVTGSPPGSGRSSPKQKHEKWYQNKHSRSATSIGSSILNASTTWANGASSSAPLKPFLLPKSKSSTTLDSMLGRKKGRKRDDTIHIRQHIQETIQRQKYLLKLCSALMTYGAPTHRLEEYMRMSSRVLEIEGQFLYIPGCMIIAFDDPETHTTEVKLVKSNQGVDLGKLRETHDIYKEVVHDVIGVEEGTVRLDVIKRRKQKFPPWFLVIVYGLASATVGPFAFQARLIDLPIAFFLGSLLGFMQLILAPRSDMYSNVFEITAAVVTSFMARAFGSINNGDLFCFSALAQSSIALILPGYTVLCGALELQSKSMVAGSVRMVYAIIYSLFLGFGITIGTSFYGGISRNATSETTCRNPLPSYYPFLFVPPFTLCLIIINQGKWKQVPAMLTIAFAGYVVNHFSALRFASNVQIANALGALAVGVLGNLYSRIFHGLSAAALIPAIFVQVPSGLAASGSLVSGITSANQITSARQNVSSNSTTAPYTTINNTTQAAATGVNVNSVIFNVGFSMIQVAIGITVGLFMSSLIIYPVGKKRSGLFSF